MANATVTLTAYNAPYGIDQTNTRMYLHGLVAFSASPGTYPAGGLLPTYSPIKDQSGQAVLLPTINVNPDTMWIQSIAGSGYTYQYNKATGKIQIFVTGSASQNPAAELTGGTAIPAAVSGDTIEFEAEWAKQ